MWRNKPDLPERVSYWKEITDSEGKTTYVPNTNIPSVEEVRNRWCFGLPLTKEDGTAMPDEDIKHYIDEAIVEVERRLGLYLKPTIVVSNPWERGIAEDEFDIEERPYDYEIKMWRQYGFLQLRERPVLDLLGFKMVLPNGNIIVDFFRDDATKQWLKLDKVNAQLNVVPYAGDPTLYAMLGGTSSGFPFATGMINANLPHMFYVDYVVGMKQYGIPEDIRGVIAKMASIDILGIAGDAILAGVASMSTSIDGLSESMSTTASATNATYGAHILQYQKEVDKFFSAKGGGARSYYRGFTMTGL